MNTPDPDWFEAWDVSRETGLKLEAYVALLLKWQQTINLVAASTLDSIWSRHIADSLQLATSAESFERVADLGSGGGLPGVVFAIYHDHPVVLVESDRRKAAFLSTVRRELALKITLINKRVESQNLQDFDLITARAFAPLPRLLTAVFSQTNYKGRLHLLKGQSWREEVDAAQKEFQFNWSAQPSKTDSKAVILTLDSLERR